MNFDWHKQRDPSNNRVIKEWPAIRVRLLNGGQYVDFYGILDSGADDTVLPRWIADAVSIDIVEGRYDDTSVGIGGAFNNYYFPAVEIMIGGNEHTIPVRFVDTNEMPPLLGISGIFQEYLVIIDARKMKIELKPFDE